MNLGSKNPQRPKTTYDEAFASLVKNLTNKANKSLSKVRDKCNYFAFRAEHVPPSAYIAPTSTDPQ